MPNRKTGKPPLPTTGSNRRGFVTGDPSGRSVVLAPVDAAALLGTAGSGGSVLGPTSSTDNALARWDGTGGNRLQNGLVLESDDGRLTTLTNPTGAQDAATKAYVDAQIAAVPTSSGSGAGGHLHGLMRILGDGATTTFGLLDIAEYLEHVGVGGSFQDPATFTLSADGTSIVFDSAPAGGAVLALEYVIASL